MANYGQHFSTLQTPQRRPASPKQVENNAGGYTFQVDPWDRLDRFLILGSAGGTYYVSERELTIENAQAVQALLAVDGPRVVRRIVEISETGRAPSNDPAIFALAMAAGFNDQATRKAALAALPQVCRTGTHLFHFVRDVKKFRGWGRGLRQAVAKWYTAREPGNLAYQVMKYRARDGFSHRDVLRLAHPVGTEDQNEVLKWILADATKDEARYATLNTARLPRIVGAYEEIKAGASLSRVVALIGEHKLPREVIPSELQTKPEIWEALLPHMGAQALVRSLNRMSAAGLLQPFSDSLKLVTSKLGDAELKRSRIHPMAILIGLKQYSAGHGLRGSLSWTPSAAVVDALDAAFYKAFGNVEPTGKNLMLALDVSGSMSYGPIANTNVTPREASAALAMITANVEPNYAIVGFCGQLRELTISPRQRLDDVVKKISGLPFGNTDCSLPMVAAHQAKLKVDGFVIYTDNETWVGGIHPHQALEQYRRSSGRQAKSVVVGMTATNFTIANPNDAGMLDVVGFDAATPQLISDFLG